MLYYIHEEYVGVKNWIQLDNIFQHGYEKSVTECSESGWRTSMMRSDYPRAPPGLLNICTKPVSSKNTLSPLSCELHLRYKFLKSLVSWAQQYTNHHGSHPWYTNHDELKLHRDKIMQSHKHEQIIQFPSSTEQEIIIAFELMPSIILNSRVCSQTAN